MKKKYLILVLLFMAGAAKASGLVESLAISGLKAAGMFVGGAVLGSCVEAVANYSGRLLGLTSLGITGLGYFSQSIKPYASGKECAAFGAGIFLGGYWARRAHMILIAENQNDATLSIDYKIQQFKNFTTPGNYMFQDLRCLGFPSILSPRGVLEYAFYGCLTEDRELDRLRENFLTLKSSEKNQNRLDRRMAAAEEYRIAAERVRREQEERRQEERRARAAEEGLRVQRAQEIRRAMAQVETQAEREARWTREEAEDIAGLARRQLVDRMGIGRLPQDQIEAGTIAIRERYARMRRRALEDVDNPGD